MPAWNWRRGRASRARAGRDSRGSGARRPSGSSATIEAERGVFEVERDFADDRAGPAWRPAASRRRSRQSRSRRVPDSMKYMSSEGVPCSIRQVALADLDPFEPFSEKPGEFGIGDRPIRPVRRRCGCRPTGRRGDVGEQASSHQFSPWSSVGSTWSGGEAGAAGAGASQGVANMVGQRGQHDREILARSRIDRGG